MKTFEKMRLIKNNADNPSIRIHELLDYTHCMLEPILTYLPMSSFGAQFCTPSIYTKERVL